MALNRAGWIVAMAVLLGAGCGPSNKEEGGAPPATAQLLSIEVDPAQAELLPGDSVALAALGHFSDGSVASVEAHWTVSSGSAELDADYGETVTATGELGGTSVVVAAVSGLVAWSTVVVDEDGVPADPGKVYGCDETAVWSYPADAGTPPTRLLSFDPDYGGTGFVSTPSGDELAALIYHSETGDRSVARINPATGVATIVVTMDDALFDRPFSLERDREGHFYTVCFGDNRLLEIDPSGGITHIDTFSGWFGDLAMGPGDELFYAPGYSAGDWIYRRNPAGGAPILWATEPAGLPMPGYISTGLAINPKGEAFMSDVNDNVIHRNRDVNGDGSALDAGEQTAYATMPWGQMEYFTYGVSAVRGRSLLINVYDWVLSGQAGIYWLVDADRSDAIEGESEFVLYNSTPVMPGLDGGCVVGRR